MYLGETCDEDTNTGAGEEDEGANLGHDLVTTDEVPLLTDGVLEVLVVVLPGLAGLQGGAGLVQGSAGRGGQWIQHILVPRGRGWRRSQG